MHVSSPNIAHELQTQKHGPVVSLHAMSKSVITELHPQLVDIASQLVSRHDTVFRDTPVFDEDISGWNVSRVRDFSRGSLLPPRRVLASAF